MEKTRQPAALTAKELALYLGCQIIVERGTWKGTQGILGGVDENGSCMLRDSKTNFKPDEDWVENDAVFDILVHKVKPILRRLESMTEEEKIELQNIKGMTTSVLKDTLASDLYLYPAEFQYLLSKGFDCFGWIDDGRALDQSTLNK